MLGRFLAAGLVHSAPPKMGANNIQQAQLSKSQPPSVMQQLMAARKWHFQESSNVCCAIRRATPLVYGWHNIPQQHR